MRKVLPNVAKSVQSPAAMMGERVKGHAAALLAACLFGLMSPMCKFVMQDGTVNGISLALLRVTCSAVLFWVTSCFVKSQKIRREDWPALIAMSLCGIALNQFLYVGGVQYTVPTHAGVTSTAIPVFTLLMAALFMGQHICFKRAVGIAIACMGALTMVLSSAGTDEGNGAVIGDLMCLGSQVFAAAYFVFFAHLIKRYHVLTLLKWLFTISALTTLPLFATLLEAPEWSEISHSAWLSLGYIVIVGTFLCYLVLNYAQARLDAAVVATYNYLQPVVAAAFSLVLGVGQLTMSTFFAIGLILVGVRLTGSSTIPQKKHLPAPVRGRWIG